MCNRPIGPKVLLEVQGKKWGIYDHSVQRSRAKKYKQNNILVR